jgi:hypothetical protein
MFEHHRQPLLSRPAFARRVARHGILGSLLIAVSLGIGTVGYRAIAGLDWVDSVLNASMILTGMGPVTPMQTTAAKLFASAYAIFSGVVFLSTVGVMAAPIAHRFLHRLHLDEAEDDENERE